MSLVVLRQLDKMVSETVATVIEIDYEPPVIVEADAAMRARKLWEIGHCVRSGRAGADVDSDLCSELRWPESPPPHPIESIDLDDAVVFLTGPFRAIIDSLVVMTIGSEYELFDTTDQPEIDEHINRFGLLPLAPRSLSLGQRQRALTALLVFAGAITLGLLDLMPLYLAFLIAIFCYLLLGILPVRRLYDEVDWPVIVLLGAMIPVGQALETTGTTTLLADSIVDWTAGSSVVWVLVLLLVVTMFLSDIINNAATVLVMAPIAVSLSQALQVNTDPLLMAVAVGASCAFLTPIGHQSNTLVMGPGGYKFGDYWRMGLPLEVLIVVVSVPLILWAWPL